ncbi:MAG: hypothetical protein AAB583_01975 [Patescibacteria group bacterium]
MTKKTYLYIDGTNLFAGQNDLQKTSQATQDHSHKKAPYGKHTG